MFSTIQHFGVLARLRVPAPGGGGAPSAGDCIAYYKLEDNTDSVGSADLTISGATSTTGIINNGYSADGINDQITGPDPFADDSTYSISVWFQSSTKPSLNSALFSQTPGTNDFSKTNLIQYKTDGSVAALVGDGVNTTTNLQGGVDLSDGNPHHVVLTVTSGSQVLYVDGSPVDTDNQTRSNTSMTTDFQLFATAHSSPHYMNGLIDELAIFDVVLTQDNVTYLYNSGSPGSAQQYPFT